MKAETNMRLFNSAVGQAHVRQQILELIVAGLNLQEVAARLSKSAVAPITCRPTWSVNSATDTLQNGLFTGEDTGS